MTAVSKTLQEKAMKEKAARQLRGKPRAEKKTDSDIVAETEEPLRLLEKSIKKVNLIDTLKDDLGDPLMKYRGDNGEVDDFKVPQNLYIVAIIHEVIKASKKIDLGICVRHGVIYGNL